MWPRPETISSRCPTWSETIWRPDGYGPSNTITTPIQRWTRAFCSRPTARSVGFSKNTLRDAFLYATRLRRRAAVFGRSFVLGGDWSVCCVTFYLKTKTNNIVLRLVWENDSKLGVLGFFNCKKLRIIRLL